MWEETTNEVGRVTYNVEATTPSVVVPVLVPLDDGSPDETRIALVAGHPPSSGDGARLMCRDDNPPVAVGISIGLVIGLVSGWILFGMGAVEAGKIVGETSTYAREQGVETRFFYVASGDGVNQVEFICKAFTGRIGSRDVTSSVWQVRRFTYDSSDRVSTIAFAGDDDAFNQVCNDRVSLDYS